MSEKKKGLTYAEAGVDIDAGEREVELIKDSVKATYTEGVLGDLGGFGGLYTLKQVTEEMEEPVLVSGTDGVGTKLRLAIDMGIHGTIGQDCVAMSVNDVLVQGARPLFFLDYIATGKLTPELMADIVKGVADACIESGCALLGGETAEMAGFYAAGDYDVAGFAVGVVNRKRLITGETIRPGDVILGLPSSGVHSNGYSLVRRIISDNGLDLGKVYGDMDKPLGEVLLTPTRLYPKAVSPRDEGSDAQRAGAHHRRRLLRQHPPRASRRVPRRHRRRPVAGPARFPLPHERRGRGGARNVPHVQLRPRHAPHLRAGRRGKSESRPRRARRSGV